MSEPLSRRSTAKTCQRANSQFYNDFFCTFPPLSNSDVARAVNATSQTMPDIAQPECTIVKCQTPSIPEPAHSHPPIWYTRAATRRIEIGHLNKSVGHYENGGKGSDSRRRDGTANVEENIYHIVLTHQNSAEDI